MSRFTLVMVGLFILVAPLCFSQSLASVAKKEKERRDAIEEKSQTIDEWELHQAEGDGLSVTGTEVSEEESSRDRLEKPGSSDLGSPPAETSSKLPDAKEMRRRREAYNERVAAAQASVKSAQAALKTCRQARRHPSSVHVGDEGCKGAQQRLRSAQDSLRFVLSRRP